MKNASIYIVIVLCLFVLSGCSSINNDDLFDKKVKCYELGRQYINDKNKELVSYEGDEENAIYYINGIYLSNQYNTCFMEYTLAYTNPSLTRIYDRTIIDILTSEIVDFDSNKEGYSKVVNKIKNIEGYEYDELYAD